MLEDIGERAGAGTRWAGRGSQRWLQVAVNRCPEALNRPLRESLGLANLEPIQWISPLERDGFCEYRDGEALQRLAIRTKRPLADFWPARGPVWDGLGTVDGRALLVEAKSHIREMVSSRSKASPESRLRIETSLRAVQDSLGLTTDVDWSGTFYQYANRIAHLHFLRVQNDVPAELVFVHFLNDSEMGGPSNRDTWDGAIQIVECYLGLSRHRLQQFVHHVFVHVDELKPFAPAAQVPPPGAP
jgi:hypothetical protein